jgi:hypothetical protein
VVSHAPFKRHERHLLVGAWWWYKLIFILILVLKKLIKSSRINVMHQWDKLELNILKGVN